MPTVSASSSQAQRLRELIRDVKFAMLTTRSIDGTLSSRPMTTLQTEFDGTLWFLAAADSLKAMDIEQRPKVNLGYTAPDSGRYVSVSGTARVLHDRAKARELWQPHFQAWFPGGPDDDTRPIRRRAPRGVAPLARADGAAAHAGPAQRRRLRPGLAR